MYLPGCRVVASSEHSKPKLPQSELQTLRNMEIERSDLADTKYPFSMHFVQHAASETGTQTWMYVWRRDDI